jgi:sterol desaturase/sphingolipid hydroxylase (fatty acid hydroxylase superfamily)
VGVAFAFLSRWSPCNEGKPWWEKRGLVTDLSYWIFSPIFTRYIRIWLTVSATVWFIHISDGDKIADFFANGHGPVSRLPLWVQGALYLVGTDFVLYWIHRGFHQGFLWKYHAVHHASEDLDWISAARFHPVNLALGTGLVDVVSLLCGISPRIFIVIGPFLTVSSCLVHANLSWTFGPLRHVFASPVFHRWHHATDAYDRNFSGTFAIWDVMFGTYHMPQNALPSSYGIADKAMPEGLLPQLLYPILQGDPVAHDEPVAVESAA